MNATVSRTFDRITALESDRRQINFLHNESPNFSGGIHKKKIIIIIKKKSREKKNGGNWRFVA